MKNSGLGRKSCGPRTALGKSHSSQNALKHGLLSKTLILDGENALDFRKLLTDLSRDWQPQGAHERSLVEMLATLIWRERRLIIAERALISRSGPFVGIQGRSDYELPLQACVHPPEPAKSDEKLAKFSRAIECLAKLDAQLRIEEDGSVLELEFYWGIALELREIYGNCPPTGPEPEIVQLINRIVAGKFIGLGEGRVPPETNVSVVDLRAAIASEILRLDGAARKHLADDAILNSQASLLLPPEHLYPLLRYESHISRLKERTIKQLERAQDRRSATSTGTTIDLELDP